ncbi:ribonuclease P protein subunit p14-like [Hydractinia symbiolongicarpus]|uniref:ribonuclease P protein subunit p14-like n=1 Tax=Hydractinia symbiolongicarpus TaxID=13093 RepID=UPI00254F6361|nr:ribonuclease P protein subunit p14-like [Hydractinia symbiolongicarpus]
MVRQRKISGLTFAHLKVTFAAQALCSLTQIEFESAIFSALDALHGHVGAAINFSVDAYTDCLAEISVREDELTKFWSALTLYGFHENKRCMFTVKKL